MPSDVERQASERDALVERGAREVKRLWDGFVDFAFEGNVLQIAFGLILASIFTDLVKSFVSDVLMPPISILLPIRKNIQEKFAVLQAGDSYDPDKGYNTPGQALEDGAVIMTYGSFVYQCVSFFMVGLALYGMANLFQTISNEPIIKHTKKCKYCRKRINEKALRCINCSSWQDGREDRVQY
ncbi:hypothetical protein NLU13_0650 [Sarocladium strictum]|uniref:Large-conductance mechanosensitive channel n=1 Tax=Sarocladium strictum TaxID=5046 RepID=A0AA39GRC8_SARSR|nr:hypothetical protein NLU13_0650 [Sarocladium strictum]